MLSGEFQRKLRRLNPELRIWCGNDDSKAAGLYQVVKNEYDAIMGVDKNYIPEWPSYDEKGHIVLSGWRRVLNVLIFQKKLVDLRYTEKVFRTRFYPWSRGPKNIIEEKSLDRYIREAQSYGVDKDGNPKMRRDDVMDIAKEIRKNDIP